MREVDAPLRGWELVVVDRPPFGWVAVDVLVESTCTRCGVGELLTVPALADWFDRSRAEAQVHAADGSVCARCGLLIPLELPLLQYRRGDVPGLLIGFPPSSPPDRDRQLIQDVLSVVDPLRIDGAGVVVSARLHWWRTLWRRPIGPVLYGSAVAPLPESTEETERWRDSTVAALALPAIRTILSEFVNADSYASAVEIARRHDQLLSPRWQMTVDALGRDAIEAQDDAPDADLLRHRLGRLRQMRLLGIDHADDAELTGELAGLTHTATTATDRASRLAALRTLSIRPADAAPTAISAAALTSLVAALHADPERPVDAAELLATAQQALSVAIAVFGDEHPLVHAARLNLAVVTEERTDLARPAALAEATRMLDDLAPRAARYGTALIADIATNYATIASQAGSRSDSPEDAADLLADAAHIARLVKDEAPRSRLVALVDQAAALRARMTGPFRANAQRALQMLEEALEVEEEHSVLSPAERVLLYGNVANATFQTRELAPDEISLDRVRAAAVRAIESTKALARLHPTGIDTLNNAGSILASAYSDTVLDGQPDIELWRSAHDHMHDAMERAADGYPRGHPVRLRVTLNFATVFGRPVDGRPVDPERCAELLNEVIDDAPNDRAEFVLAAATNLGQLRVGQGRWPAAVGAYKIALDAQDRLLRRARTTLTRLGEVIASADLSARLALAHGMCGEFAEAVAVIDANRGKLLTSDARRDATESVEAQSATVAERRAIAVVHAITSDYGTVVSMRLPDGARFGIHSALSARDLKPVIQALLEAEDLTTRCAHLDEIETLLRSEITDPISTIAHASIVPLDEVHIVACGPLAACPLHAVRDNSDRRLIDTWTVRYRFTGNPTSTPPMPNGRRAVAVIDPTGDLPYGRAEREALTRWAATVEEPPSGWSAHRWLTSALPHADVLHLACHARSDPDEPMNSSFAISADERVSVAELAQLDTPQLELVVAPACQSASPSPMAPDELLGAAHALVHAGARCVIASLWDADDAPTALVTARLYHELGEGHPPSAALAHAQRYVAAVTGPALADLARARLDDDQAAAWLPYDLAIELLGLTAHPRFRSTVTACFAHPAEWATLTYLER